MFDNRINFGHALRPFEHYEMDSAIGTTYSLSLEALMFIPVTLFFGEELNTTEKVLTSEMFDALTKVPEQVQIFCQRGKLQKPPFYHNILAFWEKSVEQIQMESHLNSFHPKIWLVRYLPTKKGLPVKYKFICSSRNLTLTRDWDMAVHMEGEVQKSKKSANKPLFEFMQMLNERAKKKIKQDILDEIMHINFELKDDQVAYAFHPIGFNNKKHPLLIPSNQQESLLLISPFLDKTTIDAHRKRSKEFYLFSNGHELDKIEKSSLDEIDEVLMFHPLLEQPFYAEPAEASNDKVTDQNIIGTIEPDSEYNPSMNLHAKLYITQNKKQSNWYIGSANCSSPATERNIEFLTEIAFAKGKATIDHAWSPLVAPPKGKGLFIPYESGRNIETIEDKKVEADLRRLIFELADLQFFGATHRREDGRFDIEIKLENTQLTLPADWKVSFHPLSAMSSSGQEIKPNSKKQIFRFLDFEESQLTPYLLCTIDYNNGTKKEVVVDCIIEFSVERMRKIFKSIINNQEKLFKYLTAILSKDETIPLVGMDNNKQNINPSTGVKALENYPLYEKLLLAASRDKKKIKLAAKTIEYLQKEKDENGQLIVDENFASFFEIFKPFAND
jgi:hypothetical protein